MSYISFSDESLTENQPDWLWGMIRGDQMSPAVAKSLVANVGSIRSIYSWQS